MTLSLATGLNRIGLPLIITSNKPNLCFLIDTGATHNIVFSYVYYELSGYFKPTHETSLVMGIEGQPNEVEQVEATIAFENTDIKTCFSVLDATRAVIQVQQEHGVQIHGILGIPFLTQNKWILDFNKLSVQC